MNQSGRDSDPDVVGETHQGNHRKGGNQFGVIVEVYFDDRRNHHRACHQSKSGQGKEEQSAKPPAPKSITTSSCRPTSRWLAIRRACSAVSSCGRMKLSRKVIFLGMEGRPSG